MFNTITLNDSDKEVINAVLDGGEFSTPEEVVHAGLSLLKERQKKIQAMRQAIKKGEESGESRPFDPDTFKERMHKKHPNKNA